MTTVRRDGTHCATEQDVLLVHPETLDVHRCRVTVTRRGLFLRRVPDEPSRLRRGGTTLRVPWWTVHGFSADDTDTTPEGAVVQVVEVVTDAGTLSILAPAPEVSVLLGRVGRWSGLWNRSRQPAMAALARGSAIAAATLRPLGAPFRWAGAVVARATYRAALWAAVILGTLAHPFVVALRPVGRLVTRVVAPVRRRLAATVVGLAMAAAWRRTRAVSARVLGGGDEPGRRIRPVLVAFLSLLLLGGAGYAATGGGSPVSNLPHAGASPPSSGGGIDSSSMARMLEQQSKKAINLPKATTPPAPAPPSLASEPPLSPHEVFGFAPYWTLTQGTGFDVGGMTTLAYFSIDVNANGSLAESGSGWDGYQSQDLANLVTRAHAAGVRVVLTVTCFDQGTLNAVTSSPTAPTTLSATLLQAIEAKNLDGVNLDFEGEGSGDQAGLTNLVTKVSAAIHGANPHYQVTMDTYASSAGDPNGFYNIPALAPAVDGFFVMAYQLNLQGSTTPASPLTSSMFSDLTTAQQYSAAVPPAKVIMGLPYYGYSWPTTNGTMAAQPTGTATPIAYAQIVAGGHPTYWDSVTDTAWTSYQVGNQWYEDYFEDPSSLYLAAQMAQTFSLGGVGIWALGMDGNDPQMLAALDGFAPATKDGVAGPSTTAPSASSPAGAVPTTTTTPNSTVVTAPGGAPAGGGATTTTTAPSGGAGSPPTTTGPAPPAGGTSLHYSGTWQGQQVALTLLKTPLTDTTGQPALLGQLTGFQTDDSRYSCLESASGLAVWELGTTPSVYVVKAAEPADCATAEFTFPVPTGSPPAGGTAAAPSSSPSPSPSTVTAPTTTTTPPTTVSTTSTTAVTDAPEAAVATGPPAEDPAGPPATPS